MSPASGRPRSTEASFYRFCPRCGQALARDPVPGGRPRCAACGFVHWRNPIVGVAAVIREEAIVALLGEETVRRAVGDLSWRPEPERGRVLLVRRSASRAGLWCLPCGYVEFDEEIREALVRETREETGLLVEPGPVLAVHSNFHDPDRQSVGTWFAARPVGGSLQAGDDADAVIFVSPDAVSVPLAFPTDALVLRDLARG